MLQNYHRDLMSMIIMILLCNMNLPMTKSLLQSSISSHVKHIHRIMPLSLLGNGEKLVMGPLTCRKVLILVSKSKGLHVISLSLLLFLILRQHIVLLLLFAVQNMHDQ